MKLYLLILDSHTDNEYNIFSTKEKAIEYIENKWNIKSIYNKEYDAYICGEHIFFDPTYYIKEIEVDK